MDDGSTDGSLAILRRYESAHDNIHVLTQQNRYAGVNGDAVFVGVKFSRVIWIYIGNVIFFRADIHIRVTFLSKKGLPLTHQNTAWNYFINAA